MSEQTEELGVEQEHIPKEISQEFLVMESTEFRSFLKTLQNEPILSITIDWVDVMTARKLKAFLEDPYKGSQKRFATIRATDAQHLQELNVFGSGVKWEKVE